MEARITFRCQLYIKGQTTKEIIEKFENMPLFSAEALEHFADLIETDSIEDAETGNEL